jgi:hypothetical protein
LLAVKKPLHHHEFQARNLQHLNFRSELGEAK